MFYQEDRLDLLFKILFMGRRKKKGRNRRSRSNKKSRKQRKHEAMAVQRFYDDHINFMNAPLHSKIRHFRYDVLGFPGRYKHAFEKSMHLFNREMKRHAIIANELQQLSSEEKEEFIFEHVPLQIRHRFAVVFESYLS